MSAIPSGYYYIETIVEYVSTIIVRVRRNCEPTSVLIKSIKTKYPTLEEITHLNHEYTILKSLNIKGILKPLSWENANNQVSLILEDFAGESLEKWLGDRPCTLTDFLTIAIQLASTLADLHQNQIVHKDIKPQNILIDPERLQVKLTNFSVASRSSKDNPVVLHSNVLEGTLAYMSPEQTGRMNRFIDRRTDFYSLGVTFYQMLTGKLPFRAIDPLELIHSHIARIPVPPHELQNSTASEITEIPNAISDIVMKLLAKTAEQRYQSAYGLQADLEHCMKMLCDTGTIQKFIPGTLDRRGQFFIPQKLYDRDAEVTSLMKAFERVCEGTTELVLVSGYSGIGKTSLVKQLDKYIVQNKGYAIAGKCDLHKQNIPYIGFIQAFQKQIGQLLTESASNREKWKVKLLKALRKNGQVIIEVIPELELIIGKQPEVPQLGPTEAQNRFNRVFKQFIHVFAQKEHPLVVFLDDLQWANTASLKLVELLMSDRELKYLLLIGAYRDNEVNPTHSLIEILGRIKHNDTPVRTLTLQPLAIDFVTQLVADTLDRDTSKVKHLAELIYRKTTGNPLFVTQLLKSLTEENLLSFDFNSGVWQWDIEGIKTRKIADDVGELMADKIQNLPEKRQNVLKLAACIGNSFTLDILAIADEKSESETAANLWDALEAGLVLPVSNPYKISNVGTSNTPSEESNSPKFVGLIPNAPSTYKFLHDRVQQATYSLIPESEKKQMHLKIGEILLKLTPKTERLENIFEIVNQLNRGRTLLKNCDRQHELAFLNLIAGRKAKSATAYEAAVRYLQIGISLLSTESWETQYQLTLDLYQEAAATEYLTTHFEKAEALAEIVLAKAKMPLDRVQIYETKIQFYIARNQLAEAIEIGVQVLKMLGVSLPENPTQQKIYEQALHAKSTWKNEPIEQLAKKPEMADLYKQAAMRILMNITAPAYIVNPLLMPLIVLKMVNLCIQYGNSPMAAYGYGYYAVILCGVLGDIEAGYRFGQLSLQLLDKFNAKWLSSKIYVLFYAAVLHWKEPAQKSVQSLKEGIDIGLETGDIEYACYSAQLYCQSLFFVGMNLEIAAKEQTEYMQLSRRLKQSFQLDYIRLWRQLTFNLQGRSADPCHLVGQDFNEEEMLPFFIETHNQQLTCCFYLAKCVLFYLFKDSIRAVENAQLALEYQGGVTSLQNVVEINFYSSLSLLARYQQRSEIEQKKDLRQVQFQQKTMKKWVDLCPENNQHKFYLVEAEKAKVLRSDMKAMENYDLAIAAAQKSGYIHEEAIAHELAGEFYHARGRDKVARVYFTDAYSAYRSWGATAKLTDLSRRYPHLFSQFSENSNTPIQVSHTIGDRTGLVSAFFDLSTVIKASQAISDEIMFDKLLDKLMNVAIENAGATRGVLLLKRDGQLFRVAEGYTDKDNVILLPSVPLEAHSDLPVSAIDYVENTQSTVVLNNATLEGRFTTDYYILKSQPKSILCLPVIYKNQLNGILYLENHLIEGSFTTDRVEILNLLSSQAAISLENASLYQELQTYSEKLEDRNAQLTEINRSLSDEIEERQRVERDRQRLLEQLELKRGQLEAVLQQMPAGVIIAEAPSGKLILGNRQVEEIWRHSFFTSDDIMEYGEWKGFHPDKRVYRAEEWPLARSISTGEVVMGEEIDILRGDGTEGTMRVSSAPIRNGDGQIIAGVVTFFDITERKQAELKLRASLKEKEVLFKEVHHRVKNNLQIISSLLNLQAGYIDDEKVIQIFKDSENRLASMALIHEQLYQSEDLATIDFYEYIQNLVADLFASYEMNYEGIELQLDVKNIYLEIDEAVPCGLIINELVLNSMKHAFVGRESGQIKISFSEHNNSFRLGIADNGIGFPQHLDFQNTESLGLQLVIALTHQLDGQINLHKSNDITEFEIVFPQPVK